MCDPGFHAFCIRQTERRFSKKDWLIGQFFVRKVGVVGVLLNVSMLVYVTWITRTYIRMFMYILASIFTYIHIFFSSLILPNFMIVKGLLDANTKCLFCGEFCWAILMIKIKITLTLFIIYLYIYIYNDCVVKGYVV